MNLDKQIEALQSIQKIIDLPQEVIDSIDSDLKYALIMKFRKELKDGETVTVNVR